MAPKCLTVCTCNGLMCRIRDRWPVSDTFTKHASMLTLLCRIKTFYQQAKPEENKCRQEDWRETRGTLTAFSSGFKTTASSAAKMVSFQMPNAPNTEFRHCKLSWTNLICLKSSSNSILIFSFDNFVFSKWSLYNKFLYQNSACFNFFPPCKVWVILTRYEPKWNYLQYRNSWTFIRHFRRTNIH
jgi:hypothetical protein